MDASARRLPTMIGAGAISLILAGCGAGIATENGDPRSGSSSGEIVTSQASDTAAAPDETAYNNGAERGEEQTRAAATSAPDVRPSGEDGEEENGPIPGEQRQSSRDDEADGNVPQGDTPPADFALDRCHVTALSARISEVKPAAGNRYAVLVFTNESGEACTLNGHTGMLLLDENGDPLPTDVRKQQPGPRRVVLEPDTSASASLRWGGVGGDKPPVDARYALVTPPDAYEQLRVPFDWRVYKGRISVTSVVDGNDGAGQ